ncbi:MULTISPECIES: ABC transporter ATP-binding protein [Anaerococcus]|uniref:ABC transporter ATP-binding protein n=1 Tax=Anaerococcus TaxID=165779 RepID=UPI001AE2A9EE|nr:MULTISPECIES: ABC transporter ATP-binding protein [Anaerococcus]MBP2069982.1 osmoprotectant transport system ATP-binding protein [Anaerococcus nagyae]MDU1828240.1 ABC transporter ATP-binding protein [Anaerococcus sp.]MDU1864502.1 ABC transporter ATP-binding protein [Anaerococcus sp.]MDU3210688.1 ABC transporter ATP-binding protein [Anaerococcus sp.]
MIEFKDVSKIYPGNQVAVKDINLKFNDSEFICFIGTSGSGKTTCMRMINRMNEVTEGEILIDGSNIKDYNPVDLRRKIGYVIQQIGLFPHMTVFDNIVLVPRLLEWDEDKLRPIAENLIEKVDLPISYLDKYPQELSGGQQQRIGVIRALAADQDIILMDEPFGALDPITRDSLQKIVKRLQKEMGKTIVFVSHDMDEALTLADRIVIMNKGEVIQFDTPENILKNPASDYVRDLLGEQKLNEAKTSYETVDKIMLKNPISLSLEKNTYDALLLMRQKRVDTVFVVDKDNKLLGQVGMFDILKYGKNVKDLDEVTKPVYSITSNTRIMNAISDVYNLDTKNLPVVDDKNRLIGLITRATIVDTIYTNLRDDSSDKQEETRDKDDNLEELMKEASHDSKQNLGNKGDSNG